MLFETDRAMLDSGRWVNVDGGIIGLSMDGTVIHTGGRPMMVRDGDGSPVLPLSVAERLDVARTQLRAWSELVTYLESLPRRGPAADFG